MLDAKTEKDSVLEVKNNMQPSSTHSIVLHFAFPVFFTYFAII